MLKKIIMINEKRFKMNKYSKKYNGDKKTVDKFFKQRQNARRAVMLTKLEEIESVKGDHVSLVELYHEVFDKGYSYSIKTLERDLEALKLKGLVFKDIQYMGRGYGTKSFWRINHEKD